MAEKETGTTGARGAPNVATGTTGTTGAPNVATSKKSGGKVRVLVDNLGPKLYRRGQVTDDPEVVALLKVEGQKLVEAAD